MESESKNISSLTNDDHPRSRVKLIAVIAVVAISIVVGALLVAAFLSSPQGQDAWLFKGAYAKYEGTTSMDYVFMSMSISFNVRQEVIDFNSTHALVSTSFRMSSSIDEMNVETLEDENSAWVPLSKMGFINAFEEVELTNSYESTVDIDGFGTRTCMVYEYGLSDEGLTMTVYVDKAIGWPLKMTINMESEEQFGLELGLDINLVETNIPA